MRHSSFLEVNLNLLGENIQKIKDLAPKARPLPMVKAEAYGNGLIPVSNFLSQDCGIDVVGCATLAEALRIFQEDPQFASEVMVFSEVELHDQKLRQAYLDLNITPVIHRRSDLDLMLGLPELRSLPLVIKVNTGMNRLGLSLSELEEYAPKLRQRGVQHLMTHFACSYFPLKAGDKTNRQYDEFVKAKKILEDAKVEVSETSVANSGAIEQGFGINETYVRPGLMMYGPPSCETSSWQGKQVSRLVTQVLKTFMLKKGTPAGYGIHVAPTDLFIVLMSIGYGDGWSTFTSGVELTVKGHKAKVFGRVSMDSSYLAFAPEVEGAFKEGEALEIWGHENRSVIEIADQMKTHAYQVMCGISGRIPRIYKVK